MYNSTTYEEYMRKLLGYGSNNCMQDTYGVENCVGMMDNRNFEQNDDLEEFYPEIYKRVYPLVCNECNMNTMPITNETIEKMTDNVYKNIEVDLKIETNVNLELRNGDNRNTSSRQTENRVQSQRRDNGFLRDLIRILILRELLKRRRPEMRPPFPGNRPPFPRQIPSYDMNVNNNFVG